MHAFVFQVMEKAELLRDADANLLPALLRLQELVRKVQRALRGSSVESPKRTKTSEGYLGFLSLLKEVGPWIVCRDEMSHSDATQGSEVMMRMQIYTYV